MFGVRAGLSLPGTRPTRARDAHLGVFSLVARADGDGDGSQAGDASSLPPAARVFGRLLAAKTLRHANLCQVVAALRGRRGRLFAVCEAFDRDLAAWIAGRGPCRDLGVLRCVAFGVLSALVYLHARDIAVGNLSASTIHLAASDPDSSSSSPAFSFTPKLSHHFLAYATNNGADSGFPLANPYYVPPEGLVDRGPSCPADIWALGLILLELWHGKSPLFLPNEFADDIKGVKAGLDAILALSADPYGRATAHPLLDAFFEDLEADLSLKDFISRCLARNPDDRATAAELYGHPFLDGYLPPPGPSKQHFDTFAASLSDDFVLPVDTNANLDLDAELRYLLLSGTDLASELTLRGALPFGPSIPRLPRTIRVSSPKIETEDMTRAYSPLIAPLASHHLAARLASKPPARNPDLPPDPLSFLPSHPVPAPQPSSSQLERDPAWLKSAIDRWNPVLLSWPASDAQILPLARQLGIPSPIRKNIWAALLDIRGDPSVEYAKHDPEKPGDSDRQLDLDVPRCHQGDPLLATPEAHTSLKRILKAWIEEEKGRMVYWQGLDSVAAAFLSVAFPDESLAYCLLRAFISRFLSRFFVHDNANVLRERSASFRHVLAFHDPLLASYCDSIGLQPDLYAIPWFMTLFAHVLSLDKVRHLYDGLLTGERGIEVFVGVAVLRMVRDRILGREFNDVGLRGFSSPRN